MTVIDANNDIPNNGDILGQDGRSKNYLNEKLCNCTCTTKGEAVLMALHLAKRHSLTWVAVLDILKMLNKLYDDDILPASKYTLFKNFSVQDISYKYHIFCTNCETYLGIRINLKTNELFTCNNCCATFHEQSGSYFVTLNLTAQIRNLLNDPTIQQNIQYRFQRTREVDVMSDIYDGAVYSSLERPGQPLHDNWNLSYTFNTDGCQPSKSSKMSVWPIYVMIHELTPELRSKHILLAGLWVHKNQPNMNLFLNPFITEANVLATEGIKWHYNNREIITKVLPICCCVDSAARCTLLCMKKFNGSYGCTFCEHPTKSVNGYTKYPISVEVPPDRTDETIRESMMKYLTDNPIPNDNTKGVKGPSVLMNLQHFDMVKGMVPDYMHSILLGVTKFHTEILLTSIGEPYYAGSPNNIRIINQRLNAIVLPSSITRSPRSINERRLWKASEWRSWLIWYCLICLKGVLPKKYLSHLALLVTAIHICLQTSISYNMVNKVNELLLRYVIQMQSFFGEHAMRYNVHLLLHIPSSIMNWGPLWTHNTFSFENENRLILQMKTSPHRIAVQIAWRYFFYNSLSLFENNITTGERYNQYCDEINVKQKLKFVSKVGECTLIGSGKEHALLPTEAACLSPLMQGNCLSFKKIIVNGIRFTSALYNRPRKINDSIIVTRDGMKGSITNICCFHFNREDGSVGKKVIIFLRQILVTNEPYLKSTYVNANHIQRCYINKDGPLHACDPSSLKGQCIIMYEGGLKSFRPNKDTSHFFWKLFFYFSI
ncbi:uncharacterized protein LOC116853675 isoform X2 [Odontomachus brunneus]|nr:uncharacterized protein LOC116853675 isoform X2 [Odontomachus brunneus]XP_032690729.1 uncharacterized protein LOC116853675 isoform X2 [Odontomachus brunneus]